MGSGKGAPEYWVAVVKPGRVLFEIAGVSEEIAREALRLASHKLPLKTKLITKASEAAKAAAPKAEKPAEETAPAAPEAAEAPEAVEAAEEVTAKEAGGEEA